MRIHPGRGKTTAAVAAVGLSIALALVSDAALARALHAAHRACHLRGAEATVCPSFRLFGEQEFLYDVSGDGETLVGSVPRGDGAGLSQPMRWIHGARRPLGGLPPPGRPQPSHATARS